jgi:hypothetical protein
VYDRFDIELKQLQILMAKPGQFYSRENIFWQYDLHQGRIEFWVHWVSHSLASGFSNRLFPIDRGSSRNIPGIISEV